MLNTLHRDHINMHDLLTLLQQNVQLIRSGEPQNLYLMAQAVEYLGHYADLYHHPVEDLILAHFRDRYPDMQHLFYRCELEHQNLAVKTQRVLVPLAKVLLDGIVPMTEVLDALDDFLAAEHAHLDFEESQLFPQLKQQATALDWEQIELKVSQETDVVGVSFDSDYYQEVYAQLKQELKDAS